MDSNFNPKGIKIQFTLWGSGHFGVGSKDVSPWPVDYDRRDFSSHVTSTKTFTIFLTFDLSHQRRPYLGTTVSFLPIDLSSMSLMFAWTSLKEEGQGRNVEGRPRGMTVPDRPPTTVSSLNPTSLSRGRRTPTCLFPSKPARVIECGL